MSERDCCVMHDDFGIVTCSNPDHCEHPDSYGGVCKICGYDERVSVERDSLPTADGWVWCAHHDRTSNGTCSELFADAAYAYVQDDPCPGPHYPLLIDHHGPKDAG